MTHLVRELKNFIKKKFDLVLKYFRIKLEKFLLLLALHEKGKYFRMDLSAVTFTFQG